MASDKVTIDINDLKALKDIEPNTHAGCYELVQKAIELYGKVGGPANFTIADLDMIMFFTQIIKDFKKLEGAIDNSSLPDTSKTTLKNLLVHVQQKIRRGEYRNVDHGVGIVADLPRTVRAYEKRGLTDDKVSQLIKKLVEISSKDGLDAIFETAKEMPRITGINDGILSPILHCIKPNVFPIWNNSSRLFFLRLPIKLPCDPQGYFKDFPKDYIEASEKLNQFRDEYHLQFKNWRVIDLEAFKIGSAATAKEPSSSENSSGNLKESFRSWLVDNLNSKPEGRNKLANLYVERIEKLAEHQTGKSPSVGVFEVTSRDQFESVYRPVIDWAKKYDPDYKKYWGTAINHYKKFLQDHFSANPVSGSGGLSYVELKDENDVILPRNLIYFGAPGTGKSFKLKEAAEAKRDENGKPVEEDKNGTAIDYERVTFYPTYSYAQFVGCYKPVMKPADGGKEEIAYQFVPGPFLRVLVDALKEPTHNHCLVIEEINRANAAAVFGDVFQLLDRGGKWNDGDDESIKPFFGDSAASEYDVAASEDIKRYLKEELANCEEAPKFLKVIPGKDENGNDIWKDCRLRMPSNMYIWATMNSADQGVFPMDTAFKRRWEFEYVGIDKGEEKVESWVIESKNYKWNEVRKLINELLSLHGVNEDKLMGPWFVKPEKDSMVSDKQFKSKVLMYLWEDAARMCRREMFGDIKTYSTLIKRWEDENSGIQGVFANDTEWKKLSEEDQKKRLAKITITKAEGTKNPPENQVVQQNETQDKSAAESGK